MRPEGGLAPNHPPFGAQGTGRIGLAFDSVLEAGRAGAPWAFERLFHSLSVPLAGYLRAQGASDPDGTGNAVFLRAFSRIGSFRGDEERFRSWIFTIAHNLLVDERRARVRRPMEQSLTGTVPRTGGDVEEEALGEMGRQWVHAVLARLAPDQRDVLLMRIVTDLSVEQVAATLNKTPGAVKALQRRGLAALRQLLEREGVPL